MRASLRGWEGEGSEGEGRRARVNLADDAHAINKRKKEQYTGKKERTKDIPVRKKERKNGKKERKIYR